MGGNALKHCTDRIEKSEYNDLCQNVKSFIENTLGAYAIIPKEVESKESYGDIDVLVVKECLPDDYVDRIIQRLNLKEDEYLTHKNSNVFSFKFEGHQIDLCSYPDDDFNSALQYFSYNDFWNLIGRIAHKMGLKVGHDGIKIIVRPEHETNHVIGEVVCSKHIPDLLTLLELDLYPYWKGFDSFEEMFEYIASSKYFNPDIFLLDNRNATSRIRDKKRKTYTMFLEWCEKNKQNLTHFKFESNDERGGYNVREPYFSELIIPFFGEGVREQIDIIVEDYELRKQYRNLFDGNMVSRVTGFVGKELGGFITFMKSFFPNKKETVDKFSKEWMSKFAEFLSKNSNTK